MTIATPAALMGALGNNSSRIIIDKASIANQTAGGYSSLWRATGQPAQAAIPTSAAVPTSATTGAMGFANQTDPVHSYLAWLWAACSNSSMTLEIHDRVAHYGGLVLNSTSQQNLTGMNVDASNLNLAAARLGDANFSDLQWWLEVYTDGGATASNATINVKFGDDTDANLNVQAVGGTLRAGRMLPLTSLIASGQQGKFIKGINSVTLSASTGTAGNFGFTATRPRTLIGMPVANWAVVAKWDMLGMPEIPNDACLQMVMLTSTTSTGTVRGGGKIAHG